MAASVARVASLARAPARAANADRLGTPKDQQNAALSAEERWADCKDCGCARRDSGSAIGLHLQKFCLVFFFLAVDKRDASGLAYTKLVERMFVWEEGNLRDNTFFFSTFDSMMPVVP